MMKFSHNMPPRIWTHPSSDVQDWRLDLVDKHTCKRCVIGSSHCGHMQEDGDDVSRAQSQ